ncbi:facilitated trehalose transporter Tret1-like [Anticarsia gemmatalis]|uniref:facilitated trehalose transporter Tret1-like n=1 Tax=Anticarsia gemmatalis TaxID=129554 RepID=UPI003F759466
MAERKSWVTPFMKQCFVTAGVSLNMAGSGLVIGFTSSLLQQLRAPDSNIPIDDDSGSWIAAMPGISLVIGNFLAPPTMSKYGRKIANLVTIVPLIAGWAMIFFAKSITMLLLARFVQGLCMGMCTMLGSVLIGEYTSPKNRGVFLMTISLSIAVAVLSVHLSGAFLSWQNTSLICGLVAVVDLFIVLYSPESPSWYAGKGRYEACKQSFRWLRGDTEEDELKKMIEAAMVLKEAKLSTQKPKSLVKKIRNMIQYFGITIRKKEFCKPIIIMMHVYMLGQWSGINMLVAFPIDLLHRMLGPDCNVPLIMFTIDIHRIIANTCALYVIQKVKRRTILRVTVCLNILAILACAAYCYAKVHGMIHSEERILGISLIHIHMFSVATGSLPLCFIIAGEVFPLEYRGLAGGISVFFYSANLFTTVKTLPLLLSSVDLYGTYGLYSGILVYSLVIVWMLLPETKDRTLQDIEDEFRGRPLSPEEMKSVQSLTSWKAYTTDRRCSGPVAI